MKIVRPLLPVAGVALACLLFTACKGNENEAISAPPASTPAAAITQSQPAQTPAAPDAPVALKLATVDGGSFDTAEHRGKWLVVNFWATWCHPCLAEMPELSAMATRRKDIDVVGLAYDDIEPAALKTFVEAHPVSYPIAQVDVYDPPKVFEAPTGLPTTYLLDPQGKIAKRFVGPVTPAEIEQAVDAGGKAAGMP
ncbi:Thiol-disulfide isomerase or thioredoxin [Pseudoxanthomonas sp. GM95]|uniref:TlpA family protein disulfide reductase n=1 Tax=Pseudoxanthomonas sp. GM95 TaxID=1881043 RepID=UPI0008D0F588|nr:TlpA disulfide reductase family protein [Pseudoxanthomonas sp. GM95]SEK60506.1 Thiol-disulfide isomerase or thioredoxin [Pseudoxanthomonas sp. GM95]